MDDPNRNKTYVSMVAQLEADWHFIVPGHATTLSDATDEITEIARTLHDCLGQFVVPTEIKYGMSVYEGNVLLASRLEEPVERPVRTYPDKVLTLSNSDPITQTLEAAREHATENEVVYLRNWALNRARVKMFIDGQDQYVSRETPERYKFWSRTDEALLESEPYCDPLLINIRHRSTGGESEYNVRIGTMVDTWFQQTEIGERNRERLGAFLRRVSDSFDVIEMDYESNTYALPNYPELQVD